jgi:predicted SAM-dependent methyltransferase
LWLHLGCGPHVVEGWENLDKSPSIVLAHTPRLRRLLHRAGVLSDFQAAGFPTNIIYADVARHLPYADGSVAFIYSSHLIEHLSRWQALDFTRECARVLAPGATMRVCTPDLRQMAVAYLAGELCTESAAAFQTPADAFMSDVNAFSEIRGSWVARLIRRQFSAAIHQWLYDAESLRLLLAEGGLPDAVVRTFRAGDLPDLHLLETRPVGLFMEARRPAERADES